MHHVCKPKRMLTGLLAVVLAGFVVQSAAATRVLADGSTSSTPLVIPYLSHGIGVDQSLYSGQSSSSTPLATPALSHTADAEQSFSSGTAQAPDAFDRAVTRHEVLVNDMNAVAASSGPDAFQRAVNRNEASAGYYDVVRSVFVPAHEATIATSQSTAVRPDNRPGTRGIGTISVAQSTGSTSSTNWNTVFMAGGALLGVLLIVAVFVALSRRQHGRVLTH